MGNDQMDEKVVNNIVHYECTNNRKKSPKNYFLDGRFGEESRDTEIDKNYDEVLFYYSSNKDMNEKETEFKKNLKLKSQKFFSKNVNLQDRYKSNASNKEENICHQEGSLQEPRIFEELKQVSESPESKQ